MRHSLTEQPSSLVTGGAGFIGSHVVEHLLHAGHRVVVLDDLSGGTRANVPYEAKFVRGSVVDAQLVNLLFAHERFDYVFHLAAYAAEGLSHFIRRFNYTNNLIGSTTLINASVNHEVKAFVFTSSIAVYGEGQCLTEDMTPQPEDPYGIAKYAVEMDLAAAHRLFGLPFIVFRPHNVYGERQNLNDTYRNVVGIFMRQALLGEPLTVFGDGQQTRAFSHIDDVAPIIAKSVCVQDAYNRVFNIGVDQSFTINQLVDQIYHALGMELVVTHLPARDEAQHAEASHERLRAVFGRQEPVPLERGLAQMAVWARRQALGNRTRFTGIEVMRNLPPSWT